MMLNLMMFDVHHWQYMVKQNEKLYKLTKSGIISVKRYNVLKTVIVKDTVTIKRCFIGN